MERWAVEHLEWMTGKSKAQEVLKLVTPEVRKDVLKEVAEHLEKDYPRWSSDHWRFVARLKAGMLP